MYHFCDKVPERVSDKSNIHTRSNVSRSMALFEVKRNIGELLFFELVIEGVVGSILSSFQIQG